MLFAIGVAFGAVSGQVMALYLDHHHGMEYGASYPFYVAGELLAAGPAASIGALVAARSVKPAILDRSGSENLRAPD